MRLSPKKKRGRTNTTLPCFYEVGDVYVVFVSKLPTSKPFLELKRDIVEMTVFKGQGLPVWTSLFTAATLLQNNTDINFPSSQNSKGGQYCRGR